MINELPAEKQIEAPKSDSEIIDMFEKYIATSIDEKGIYPNPMISLDLDGKITVAALALNAEPSIQEFMNQICFKSSREAILGLDRITREGQGTEFGDVLTCFYWKDRSAEDLPEAEKSWDKWFKVGVINYQHEPRIVRPIDWNNKFWSERLAIEIKSLKPAFRVAVKKKDANEPKSE
jgi:hypothetical protein